MNFKTACFFSIVLHVAFVTFFVVPRMHDTKNERDKPVKVLYEPEKKQLFKNDIKEIADKEERVPPPYLKISPKHLTLKKSVKDIDQAENKPLPKLKDLTEGETFEQTYEKLQKNPDYVNYYDVVREKIRKNAFKYYNRRDTGRVKIIFTIGSDGELLDSSVVAVGDKTSAYLKNLVMKSIEQSRPFPAFPEGLKEYTYLKLNITVYFKSR